MFKTNLDELIKQNIEELGYDPRITGPPQHVLEQQAKVALVLNHSINSALNNQMSK